MDRSGAESTGASDIESEPLSKRIGEVRCMAPPKVKPLPALRISLRANVYAKMKAVKAKIGDLIAGEGGSPTLINAIYGELAIFEERRRRKMEENAMLKGKLEAFSDIKDFFNAKAVGTATTVFTAASVPAPRVPVSTDTWAGVVKSRKKEVTAKEVVKMVTKEVAPTLGVRVHSVNPLKGGGVAIRVPSKTERSKVVANAKFAEVGLDVSVKDKLGPRAVIFDVHCAVTTEELMTKIHQNNLVDSGITLEALKKGLKIVSRPSREGVNAVSNVIVEGTSRIIDALVSSERLYVKWFSYRVRQHDARPSCYRCLGFDHLVAKCRAKDIVCGRCSGEGHRAPRCNNAPRCRNGEFRGLPSGHMLRSALCPVYAARVARANARH